MDTKKYIIFDMFEIDNINFDEVIEDDANSLRFSNDGKSFIKYIGDMPLSIQSLTTKSQEYDYEDFLIILDQDNWSYSLTGRTI